MTARTPLIDGRVLEFHLGDCLSHALVAFKTELVACLQEIEFVARGMGVMAFDAIALQHDLMSAARIFRDDVRMAAVADLAQAGLQQFAVS